MKQGANPLSPTLPNLALTVDRVFFGRTVVCDRALPGTLMRSQPQSKEMVRLLCSNASYKMAIALIVNINILEKRTRTNQRETPIPGLEAVENFSKLMILGKPGAGKTTFLKHLAIQCISGEFQAERVPVFVTLKDFAKTDENSDLLKYLTRSILINPANKLLVDCLNSDCNVSPEVKKEIEQTLLLPMSEIEKRQQSKVS